MPSNVENGQVHETFRPVSRGLRSALGALLVAIACGSAAWKVRTLDRIETISTLETLSLLDWTPRANGQRERTIVASHTVPGDSTLRLRACAPTSVPELWMELRPSSPDAAPPLARIRLSASQTTSARCVEARWDAPRPARVAVTLVTPAPAPSLQSVTCRTSGTIHGRDLLPIALLTLGIAALVVAPRREDDTDFVPTLPWPTRGLEGIVLVVVAFFGVHVAAQAPVLLGGFSGTTMLASVIVQQLTLATVAAALLGAFTAARPRVALELTGPEPGWFRRALVAAAALVAFATLIALTLKNVGDTPIARAIDAMPTRYVIAFGALCAPLAEELFFRSLLGRMTEARVGARTALAPVVLPALFFTAMHATQLHGAWLGLVPIAAVALVNGWIRWSTRSVVIPWAVHTLYNGALTLAALG